MMVVPSADCSVGCLAASWADYWVASWAATMVVSRADLSDSRSVAMTAEQ